MSRIYYATQQIAISPNDTVDYEPVKGGQTLSLSQDFPSQEIFQLGKLAIYAQLEDLPNMDVSLTKVLDGCPLAYLLATRRADYPTLISRTQHQCKVALSIFDVDAEGANGTPLCTAELTGCDVNNLSYTFTNQGAFEESVGFISNDIIVSNDDTILNPDAITRRDNISVTGLFTGDVLDPCSIINQRQHFIWAYDGGAGLDSAGFMDDPDASILPRDIEGITDSGTNEPSGDIYTVDVESISVSATLSRESLTSLGTLAPSLRYLSVPIEVTTEIQFRAKNRPFISATAIGILNTGEDQCSEGGYNLSDQSIRIAVCDGTRIYLGEHNRVQSNNVSGGDTSGGNVVVSRTYRTFNDFTVMHENDIADNAATWWTNRSDYLTAQ